MVDGKLNCSVECSPLLGPMIMEAAEKAVAGETMPKQMIVEDRLFDTTNAAAEMPNRQY